MVNPLVFFKKGLTILGVLCLLVALSPASASSSPIELWNQSLEALKNNEPQKACQSLKTWVTEQAQNKVQSAEAMFNLALCSWETSEPSQSVLYTLESLKLRSSPFKRWTDIKLLQNLQREIGIRENLPSRISFILRMLFPSELAILLAIIGAWTMVAYLTLRKKTQVVTLLSTFIILTCGSLSLLIFTFQQIAGPLAVVSGKEEIPVVVFDKSGRPEELTRLPLGTLVELGAAKEEYSQIVRPMGGWIKTASLQREIPTN